MCSHNSNCRGCQGKTEACDIKSCCESKGVEYCYLCKEWPCDMDMHQNIRIRAFNAIAKAEGLNALSEYLYKNIQSDIIYHRRDGLKGDYDKCKDEQEVMELLKYGKKRGI